MRGILLITLSFIFLVHDASAQGCAEITTTTELQDLIARALAVGDAPGDLTVTVSRFTTVCLASAGVRNKYSFVSIVAEYNRTDPIRTGLITQFEFSCRTDSWDPRDSDSVLGSTTADNKKDVSAAHLNFALRTNCSACVNPDNPNTDAFSINPDADNHCAACSGCDDPQLCYVAVLTSAPFVPTCCNYYDENGMCVETCPASSVRAGDRDCLPECPSGQYNVNGVCENCTIDCVRGSIADDPNDCRCDCPQLYSGNNCSVCRCVNGGTCGSDLTQCECPPRYSGALCENYCENITCENGGTQVISPCMCLCEAGFGGDKCEAACSNVTDNCKECSGSPVSCTQCDDGYTISGGLCACSASCENGGTQEYTTCECSCPVGFAGDQCDKACSSVTDNCMECSGSPVSCTQCDDGYTISGGVCFKVCSQSCENGGTQDSTTCGCSCPVGFAGDQCDKACSSVIDNCKECSGSLVSCTQCEDGYSLNKEEMKCEKGGLSSGAIAGIVIAVLLLLLLVLAVVIITAIALYLKKSSGAKDTADCSKEKSEEEMKMVGDVS